MRRRVRRSSLALLLSVPAAAGQSWGGFSQRGFLETRGFFYPQTVVGDTAHAVGETLLRYEVSLKAGPAWQFSGAFDARADTHQQTARDGTFSWWERTIRRPAFDVRRFSATWHKGPVTVQLGKQFIRWGRTDILNPTDRFAPRDYLNVVDTDFLAVSGARLTVDSGGNTFDAVFVPRFTPSRTPLIGQRWAPLPALPPGFRVSDAGGVYPGGPQAGVRWSRNGKVAPSLCYYEGFNHLPLLGGELTGPLDAQLRRYYPKMRMAGGDLEAPLAWFTLKTEAAYFMTTPAPAGRPSADEYVLYVVQLERFAGEWVFAGGYAGEYVTERRSPPDFAPDRGLTRAFLLHSGYTIDANRNVGFDAAVRQNGDGVWLHFEYSQAFGQHWRATASLAWIGGREGDFLGAYRRNSYSGVALRYSF
jgi:hypothetical protein